MLKPTRLLLGNSHGIPQDLYKRAILGQRGPLWGSTFLKDPALLDPRNREKAPRGGRLIVGRGFLGKTRIFQSRVPMFFKGAFKRKMAKRWRLA